MDRKEIIDVLRSLHKITGFRVSLHGANYEEIAAFPEEKCSFCKAVQMKKEELDMCVECDKYACRTALNQKDTYIYKCRYGLTEAISPLYNFGHLTGFLMMGQTLSSGKEMANTEFLFRQKYPEVDITSAIAEITITNSELIDSYVQIMTVCARYLTLTNAIISSRPTLAENAKTFIHDNFNGKIGIKDICAYLCCSKSTLVKIFKEEFGTTVNSYICEVRLAEARRLLENESASINEIASLSGFCDQSYFSKVFLSKYGITPSEYRSTINKERRQTV